MSNFDKFKNSYKYNNPYADVKKETPVSNVKKKIPRTDSEIVNREFNSDNKQFSKDSYYIGRINALEESIEHLKFDIVTLLTILEEDGSNMTIKAVREKYYNFRAQPEHILNRVVNKAEEIREGSLNFKKDDDSGETNI